MHNIEKKKNKNPQNIKKKSSQEKCFAGPENHSTPEDSSATPRHLSSATHEERQVCLGGVERGARWVFRKILKEI